MEMNKSEILKKLKVYKSQSANKYGIKKLALFGSYSDDSQNETSDIDIIVDLDKPNLFALVHIKEELEELLGKHIDIIRDREKLNPYLKKQIKKEAIYI